MRSRPHDLLDRPCRVEDRALRAQLLPPRFSGGRTQFKRLAYQAIGI